MEEGTGPGRRWPPPGSRVGVGGLSPSISQGGAAEAARLEKNLGTSAVCLEWGGAGGD